MNLKQIYDLYPTQKDCILKLENVIWGNNPVCPYCFSTYFTPYKNENRYHCNNCSCSFSVTVRTVFHKTKVDLQKWFYVAQLILNGDKITARQLANELGVTKDTAWRIQLKLSHAIQKNMRLFERILTGPEIANK